MKNDTLSLFMLIARALSEEHRVMALYALRSGELYACDISDYLGLAPSTVSRHLDILNRVGLIVSRKNRRWIYYRLNEALSSIAKTMLENALEAFENSSEYERSRKILNKINKRVAHINVNKTPSHSSRFIWSNIFHTLVINTNIDSNS